MPNLVVYDTETTTNMSGPEKDFNQVIQIASILYDQDLNKKDSFCLLYTSDAADE